MQLSENTSLGNLTVGDLKLLVTDIVNQTLDKKGLVAKGYSPESLAKLEKPFDPTVKPISEIAFELASELTDEDWGDLPTNASELVDQYLYGIPHEEE